jgi:hypothetical protein
MAFKFNSANEQKLYQGFLTEAISKYGYEIEYWRADRSKEKDKLYSEDPYPTFVAKYPMRAWFQVIQEVFAFNKFGFQSPDAMDIIISHQQFYDVMGGDGTDESGVQPDITPRAGDFIWVKYQNRVYIITTVEQEDNVFMQKKHTYRMHVNAADVEGGMLTPETSGEEDLAIPDWPHLDPLEYDDNSANVDEITGLVVTKTDDTNPYGDWE